MVEKHFVKLDGLRCAAIVLVLIHHFATYVGNYISAGYYGVDLFFVLSGFLITNILLQENQGSFLTSYTNFIGRRTLRIFPLYYLTLLLLFLLNLETVRDNILYLATYTWNYRLASLDLSNSPVIHFWSLSVEEQFYLVWPIIVLSLRKHVSILLFITVVIVGFGYSQLVFNIIPGISYQNNFGLLTRMSSLGIGAMGILLYRIQLLPVDLFKKKSIELALILLLIFSLLIKHPLRLPLMGICSIFFVLKGAFYDFKIHYINKILTLPSVIYIGKISYGIYLFHIPLEYYMNTYLFDPVWYSLDFKSLGVFQKVQYHSWLVKFPLYSLLSIIIAGLSFKYFEKPILKLKDKYFSSRNHDPATA